MADAIHLEGRGDWEINKEAFAPPPTRHTVRGWDRAPVSAHAPRLNGQKVWKRPCALPAKIEDDGIKAQDELEKEGAGQRKKARPMGAKENITDAAWVALKPHVGNTFEIRPSVGTSPLPSILADVTNLQTTSVPTKSGSEPTMPELHFIPRKRTNTNHVITPKKPLHQTTLNRQAQRLSLLEPLKDGNNKRPRKSLRKSIRTSSVGTAIEEPFAMPQSLTFTGLEMPKHELRTELQENAEDRIVLGSSPMRKTVRRSKRSTSTSVVRVEQSNETEISIDTVATAKGGEDIPALESKPVTDLNPETAEMGPEDSTAETVLSAVGNSCGITIAEVRDETFENELRKNECESADSSLSTLGSIFDDITVASQEAQLEDVQVTKQNANQVLVDIMPDEKLDIAQEDEMRISNISCGPEQSNGIDQDQANVQEIIANGSEDLDQQTTLSENAANLVQAGEESPEVTRVEANEEREIGTEFIETSSALAASVVASPQAVDETFKEKPPTTEGAETNSSVGSTYDHDDTDMLLNFLTRVKANKAAKKKSPKRKRSLPHSPLQIPLGELDNTLSPLSLQQDGDIDSAPLSPSKRKKRGNPLVTEDEGDESKSCRRSTRTRLPVKSGAPSTAPSLIPMRRLAQEDTTVTLKRSEEKELAALTRINTRKNKAGALPALELLARKVDEKDDPILRQRLLKEVFDSKMENGKAKKGKGKGKGVTWAEELAQFQIMAKGKQDSRAEEKDEKDKGKVVQSGVEKRQSAIRVGVRSKMALGMAANGTPAPKRKVKARD